MIENLRYGIYRVIPHELLTVFEPHELDMIINGKKEIDVADLKANIKYTHCGAKDNLCRWFWDYIDTLSQQEL